VYLRRKVLKLRVQGSSIKSEVGIQSQISPCGICGKSSSTGRNFSASTSPFQCQFYSTNAPSSFTR